MFAEITKYEGQTTLIMNSGLQFMDFAANFSVKGASGAFARPTGDGPLARLEENEKNGRFYLPPDTTNAVTPKFEIDLDESLRVLEGQWLPAPFFKRSSAQQFEQGPLNWARVRVVKVTDESNETGWRITFAFDTKINEGIQETAYLSPREGDIKAGATFGLACRADGLGWYLDQKWITDWIAEVYKEQAPERLKRDGEEIQENLADLVHQAHYLNFLHLLGTQLALPDIKVVTNASKDLQKPIQVDMVLDVGNSRTCGILIESHDQDNTGFSQRYELALRDLSRPEYAYSEAFESRIEFAQASFGKEEFSAKSGRADAFLWPTIVRVGPEATRLAAMRRGTEGATGISSPKRYLWSNDPYELRWHFNTANTKSEREPMATAAPLSSLINEVGEALYTLNPDERMPVFHPHYSRSSLMMLMLSEVLTQALTQINSPAQRLKRNHANLPRHLRSIVLTVPPSMPAPEREIFKDRMQQTIGVVWKSMGWHPIDADLDDDTVTAFPALPKVHLQWDEATGGQAVYVFNEIYNNYGGRAEEFFRTMARPDQPPREDGASPYLSVATIDIGGGTTDLVINEYFLDHATSTGGSVRGGSTIVPEQRFRDGFRMAGDDIVLDILNEMVTPAVTAAMSAAGVAHADAVVSKLMGSEQLDAHDALLRQQLTLQIFYPVGLRIIKEYENYDPLQSSHLGKLTIRELLDGRDLPNQAVLNYVNEAVQRSVRGNGAEQKPFNILDVIVHVNLKKLHTNFILGRPNICKSLSSLAEVIHHFRPDVLLMTGRPSRLPGILAFVQSLQAIPSHRIISMHGYRTGGWYPFHRNERIDDPKSTAAVGAMICLLSKDGKVPNFYFRSGSFKPYSTVRYLGRIDNTNTIEEAAVYYRDINIDADEYEFPDESFTVPGTLPIGYRQINAARWPAAPLYVLTIDDAKVRQKVISSETTVMVKLRIKPKRANSTHRESFEVAEVEGASKGHITLKLNTMANNGLTQYWLDSGSVR